jgi:hypothetical protein
MYIRKNKQKQAAILFYFLIKRNRSGKYKKGGSDFFFSPKKNQAKNQPQMKGKGSE